LDSAISTLVERHERQLERRAAMASALAVGVAYGVAPAELVTVERALRSVTRADIVRVASSGLDWSNAVVATVVPASYSPAARRRAQGVRRSVRRKKVAR